MLTNCPSSVAMGNSATVRCTSSTSNPAGIVEWFVNGEKKDTVHNPSFTGGDYGGQETTLEYTTWKLARLDHRSQIICKVTHPSLDCSPKPESSPCILKVECK